MRVRVLAWNLSAGSGPSGVCRRLAELEWDMAVLPGLSPSEAARVAASLEAEWRAPTAWPGMGSLASALLGGRAPRAAGAILSHYDRIMDHRSEAGGAAGARQWAQAVQLGCGIWVAAASGPAGAGVALRWAGGEPLVLVAPLGELGAEAPTALGHGVHVAGALRAEGPARQLEPGLVVAVVGYGEG